MGMHHSSSGKAGYRLYRSTAMQNKDALSEAEYLLMISVVLAENNLRLSKKYQDLSSLVLALSFFPRAHFAAAADAVRYAEEDSNEWRIKVTTDLQYEALSLCGVEQTEANLEKLRSFRYFVKTTKNSCLTSPPLSLSQASFLPATQLRVLRSCSHRLRAHLCPLRLLQGRKPSSR